MVFIFRYASLYFVVGIESGDNELITLEIIHRYVELLDKYFGNVSHVFGALCLQVSHNLTFSHPTFICSKSTKETAEQYVKSV